MSCIVHVKPELTSEKAVSTKYALMARQRELHRLLVWSFFAVKLKVTKPFGINFSIGFSCRRGGEGGEGGEGPLDFKWQGFSLYQFILFGKFWGSEMLHVIFWGLISDPGIFLWFCLKPQGFLWVLNFAPMRSSPSPEIRSSYLGKVALNSNTQLC